MFTNYLKVILRNIKRNRVYSVINIAGLSLAIALCLLITLFVKDEFAFDHFHKKIDSIYYLRSKIVFGNMVMRDAANAPLAPELNKLFPEIELAVRLARETCVIKYNDILIEESGLSTETGFFDMFTFPLVHNSSNNMFTKPDDIVLTTKLATRIFGHYDVIGRVIALKIQNEFQEFTVTGITENPPHTSSLRFSFIIPLKKAKAAILDDWHSSLATFIRLNNSDQAAGLADKFPNTIDKHLGEKLGKGSGYSLHGLAGYHLNQGLSQVLGNSNSKTYMYILCGIGILVMLTACFNVTNLSIGNAAGRLGEIGVRKVLGAGRNNLAGQFLMESIALGVLALIAGLLLATFFLPVFNALSQKDMSMSMIWKGWSLPLILLLPVLVGTIAGGYPAFVFSRYKAVDLFQGKLKFSGKNLLGRVLIIFQFGVSIFLICMTLFLYRQHIYLIDNPLGYTADHVMEISLKDVTPGGGNNNSFLNNFKQRLGQYTVIEGVTGSDYNMAAEYWAQIAPRIRGEKSRFIVNINTVDQDFLSTMNISLLKGRSFSGENHNSYDGVILNAAFTEKIGVPDPVGRHLSDFLEYIPDAEIIGVINDFHHQSLHNKIEPLILNLMDEGKYNYCYVRINPENIHKSIEIIRSVFTEMAPDSPFKFSFLDDRVTAQYNLESRWNQIVQYATFFALIIAGSGLFAMTLLYAVRRSKEMAIRKTLGASILSIMQLFQKEFLILVVAANVIAWPASYFLMKKILQNYAYKIDLNLTIYVISGLAVVIVAMIIVSVHGYRTATANPVDNLRDE